MKKLLLSIFLLNGSLFAALPSHPSVQAFKEELGIKILSSKEKAPENACNMILVQHGSTEWSEIKRLQGWNHVPLSERGKEEVEKLAEKINGLAISAIYASSLQSSVETAEILQKQFANTTVIPMDALKGEFHGEFEGFARDQYFKQPHFQLYYFLPAAEEIFFACGKGGESKADVARRAIPALKKIANEHPGETVIVVSHGGLFKLLNFYAGKCKPEETIGIPYGDMMQIEADANSIYLKK